MARSAAGDLLKIFKHSVLAVLPENLIKRSVKYNSVNQQLTILGDSYNIQNKNVYLIGFGKAVQNMAIEIENILGSKIIRAIISIPDKSLNFKTINNNNIFYYEGARNNLPDVNAETTARKVKELVTELGIDDLLLVLISGGGSALLPLPKPPITLVEKTAVIKKLANSGADILELNTVRKRLSDLKGGQLSIKAQPAEVVTLILSDIVGDPLDMIASGPTVENQDDPYKAIRIMNKYKLYDSLPHSIKTVLENVDEKLLFPRDNVRNYVIGSNRISIAAAVKEARSLDYYALGLSDMVTGNVKHVASEYVKITKLFSALLKGTLSLESLKLKLALCHIPGITTCTLDNIEDSFKSKDLCIVLGGEITVEVKGTGKGGRNQQLALEFSNLIDQDKNEFENMSIYFLSAGTDGIDGPTDAAGAIGHLDLISEARKENIDVHKYLNENDSYSFYKQFKNGTLHVITGHTNTNVMDIHVIIIRNKLK